MHQFRTFYRIVEFCFLELVLRVFNSIMYTYNVGQRTIGTPAPVLFKFLSKSQCKCIQFPKYMARTRRIGNYSVVNECSRCMTKRPMQREEKNVWWLLTIKVQFLHIGICHKSELWNDKNEFRPMNRMFILLYKTIVRWQHEYVPLFWAYIVTAVMRYCAATILDLQGQCNQLSSCQTPFGTKRREAFLLSGSLVRSGRLTMSNPHIRVNQGFLPAMLKSTLNNV